MWLTSQVSQEGQSIYFLKRQDRYQRTSVEMKRMERITSEEGSNIFVFLFCRESMVLETQHPFREELGRVKSRQWNFFLNYAKEFGLYLEKKEEERKRKREREEKKKRDKKKKETKDSLISLVVYKQGNERGIWSELWFRMRCRLDWRSPDTGRVQKN